MRYIRNKANLIQALENLRDYVDNNFEEDGRRNNPIRALCENLEDALEKTEQEFDDIFGTEGYTRTIYGR